MLRSDHRIWQLSYPLTNEPDSEKSIPVGRLHVRDDNTTMLRPSALESRSGSLSDNGENSDSKTSRKVKRRTVLAPQPSLWFEYDEAWLSEGFALSHDLPLKDGPILPKKGKRLFAFLEDVRLDPEVRFLMEDAQEKGVSLDWMLGVKPEEAAFTSLLVPWRYVRPRRGREHRQRYEPQLAVRPPRPPVRHAGRTDQRRPRCRLGLLPGRAFPLVPGRL